MNIHEFEQEMIKRKDWPVIRVIAYSLTSDNIPHINCIAEFNTKGNKNYKGPYMKRGKQIKQWVKNWFIEERIYQAENITFEKVEKMFYENYKI